MTQIESADVAGMVNSSSDELLQELNEKKRIPTIGPWALAASVVLMVLAFVARSHPILLFILGIGLAVGVYFAFRRDVIRKTVVLLYDLEPELEQAFGILHASATQLATCSGCWHIAASGRIQDRKYHAGASELVDRKNTTIRAASPGFLKTNIQTVAIGVGRQTLYLFPDRLLVFDAGRVGAVGYNELSVTVSETRFVERSAPSDARVVDHTWRYVNKKGGPDRRFANNQQLPICLYDEIHFGSSSGLNEIIQVSRCGIGLRIEQSVRKLAQYIHPETTGVPIRRQAGSLQTSSPPPTQLQRATTPGTTRFFAYVTEQVVGPYTTEQLQALHSSSTITDDTLCCFEGSEEWQPYARIMA